MSVHGGPNISGDGLVLCLDAANPKSYPGSGSSWFDLSDTKSVGIMNNNPTYSDKYINFDGVDDYVSFEAGTLGDFISVEILVKFNALGNRMPFGFTGYDVYTSGDSMGFNTGNSDRYGLTAQQVTDLGILGNWKHIVYIMQNNVSVSTAPYTNNKIYVNSLDQSLSQVAGTQGGSTRNFTNGLGVISGWLSNTSYKASMDLSYFKIYNKKLSDSEIQQNFNALRGRFGI